MSGGRDVDAEAFERVKAADAAALAARIELRRAAEAVAAEWDHWMDQGAVTGFPRPKSGPLYEAVQRLKSAVAK